MSDFDTAREGTGTMEWADVNENIQRGCANGCLYCYAAHNAVRFKQRERGEWRLEELTKRAHVTSYPAKDGVIMFPSAHDITPFCLDASVRVLKLMLGAGNKVLIVTKPHMGCIERLVDELADYKAQILFRMTIGSTDPAVISFWEPGAPPVAERIAALRLAFESGYRTSVSGEPLLGGVETAGQVLEAVRPYVTDTVWFGKLNKARLRVDLSVPENLRQVEAIEQRQTDAEIVRLVETLGHDPLVRWKDSVQEALARAARFGHGALR